MWIGSDWAVGKHSKQSIPLTRNCHLFITFKREEDRSIAVSIHVLLKQITGRVFIFRLRQIWTVQFICWSTDATTCHLAKLMQLGKKKNRFHLKVALTIHSCLRFTASLKKYGSTMSPAHKSHKMWLFHDALEALVMLLRWTQLLCPPP